MILMDRLPIVLRVCTAVFLLYLRSSYCHGVVDAFASPSQEGRQRQSFASNNNNNVDEFRRYNQPERVVERTVVILYHKAPGVVTSHIAQDDRPTVYEDIQSMAGFVKNELSPSSSSGRKTDASSDQDDRLMAMMSSSGDSTSFQDVTGIHSKLHAIGRLDADTSGLLLLTNDGGLVHHVTNPTAASHSTSDDDDDDKKSIKVITKTYEALVMGHHTEDSLEVLWHGIDIGSKYGGVTQPVHDLQILDHPNHKSTLVSISIGEGKNRQIRRMFHAMGSGVMALKRTKIMGDDDGEDLTLEGVQQGEWRVLSDREVQTVLGWEPRILQEAVVQLSRLVERPTPTSGTRRRRRPRRR